MASEKKMKSKEISERIARNKKRFKERVALNIFLRCYLFLY